MKNVKKELVCWKCLNVTSTKILIRSFFDNPILQSKVKLFDISQDSVWNINGDGVASHLNGLEIYDNFQTLLTDALLGTAIQLKGLTTDGDWNTNIRIFLINERREIFNETMKNVEDQRYLFAIRNKMINIPANIGKQEISSVRPL